jgi:hypothetical protein
MSARHSHIAFIGLRNWNFAPKIAIGAEQNQCQPLTLVVGIGNRVAALMHRSYLLADVASPLGRKQPMLQRMADSLSKQRLRMDGVAHVSRRLRGTIKRCGRRYLLLLSLTNGEVTL